jgi:hypothetical protein
VSWNWCANSSRKAVHVARMSSAALRVLKKLPKSLVQLAMRGPLIRVRARVIHLR